MFDQTTVVMFLYHYIKNTVVLDNHLVLFHVDSHHVQFKTVDDSIFVGDYDLVLISRRKISWNWRENHIPDDKYRPANHVRCWNAPVSQQKLITPGVIETVSFED
jgi:hypothetical protein